MIAPLIAEEDGPCPSCGSDSSRGPLRQPDRTTEWNDVLYCVICFERAPDQPVDTPPVTHVAPMLRFDGALRSSYYDGDF